MAAQIAHLAFPLSVSAQAPFGVYGQPAVLLSVSGERSPSPTEPVDSARLTALGRSVLQTINALDGAHSIAGPSPYVLFDSKVVPAWAVRLLVLALIVPVLMATIDGLARVRRRGHSITQWLAWVLAGALPFAIGVAAVFGAELVGTDRRRPSRSRGCGRGAYPRLRNRGPRRARLLIALSFAVLRPLVIRMVGGEPRADRRARGSSRARWRSEEPSNPGAGAAVLLVMCVTSLAVWLVNPFAAALMVVALHLWMWVVDPDVGLPRTAKLALSGARARPSGAGGPVLRAVARAEPRRGGVGRRPADCRWSPRTRSGPCVERRARVRGERVRDRDPSRPPGAPGSCSDHRPRSDLLRGAGVTWGYQVRSAAIIAGNESGSASVRECQPDSPPAGHNYSAADPRHLLGPDHLRAAADDRCGRHAGVAGAGDSVDRADQAGRGQQAAAQLPDRAALAR